MNGVGTSIAGMAPPLNEAAAFQLIDEADHHVAVQPHGIGQLLLGLAVAFRQLGQNAELFGVQAQRLEAFGETLGCMRPELGQQKTGVVSEIHSRTIGVFVHTPYSTHQILSSIVTVMSESFLGNGAATRHRSPWVLVAGLGSAVFMAALDASIVTVALPHIENELHTTTSTAEWVVLGYVLPLIALGIPVGRWLDQVGKRLPMAASAGAFAAASVGAGLAPGIGWLIAARCVQGAFGSVLFALAAPLVTTTVPATARGRAMSVIATLGALGGVAGPPLGGLLVDTLGWPWIFYVNVPVCLMVSAIALTRVPSGNPLRLPDRHWVVETALLGGSAAVIMLALSHAAEAGLQWLSLAAVAVPLLWAWKRSETSRPVLELLTIPGIGASYTAVTATSASLLLVQFLVPYYLKQELNATAQTVGLTLLAATLAIGFLGPVGGVLADRWGTRRVAVTGTSLLTLGLALLAPLDPGWETPDLAWRLLLVGSGIGLFNAPNMTMVMSNAPASLLGTATGSINTARQLGIGLGPALATLIWATFGHTPAGMRAAVAAAAVASALVTVAMLRSRAAETDPAAPPQQ